MNICFLGSEITTAEVMWAGVVTWDYYDGIIRIHSNTDKPVINLIPHHGYGKVSQMNF